MRLVMGSEPNNSLIIKRLTDFRVVMDSGHESKFRERLAELRAEHRQLDMAIVELELSGTPDQLRITRLKKQKLALKDEIALLENRLFPDIIA